MGRAPLRRLTRVQYTNVIRGLFPHAQLPAFNLPEETLARGFENNADVQNPSALFVEAHYNAARDAVAAAMQNPEKVVPCLAGGGDEIECGKNVVRSFGRRAFRRPLLTDEADRYDALFASMLDMPEGLRNGASVVMAAMLQTPQFLYVPEFGAPTPESGNADVPLTSHEIAARLAFFLWDDLPDEKLSVAADAQALSEATAVAAEARRMLEDPRARQTVRSFHRQWLDLGRLEKTTKDPATFPMWNSELQTAMREEALSFVERAIFEQQGTLGGLLTSSTTRVNAALAGIYGITPPASGWENVSLDPSERAGILTLPGILAAHGHPVEPSPVMRGVFILDRFLCAPPPAPPPGVETNLGPTNPNGSPLTNRARYEAHVTNETCASCHATIDGAGFPFERYDSIGRHRTTDNGFPIDSSGALYSIDVAGPVKNAVDMAHRFSQSGDVRRCVTKQWFRYAFGRVEEPADACNIKTLDDEFAEADTNIRELIVAIVTSHAFLHRPGSGK